MEPRRRALFGYEPPQKSPPEGDVESVARLLARVRRRIEADWSSVRVGGEISNFTQAASGHCYFTLKDAAAEMQAVLWRTNADRLAFRPENGQAVIAAGRLSIYEARGAFQMVVERLDLAGRGTLEARFRALEARYRELGYFAAERKRPLPFLPRRIGIVTSPAGAAIHDFLRTVFQRHPRAHVILVPVRVQGAGASDEIARALDRLNALDLVDVCVVGRGGGSIEDLWAFNEEAVVEAIHRSRLPVVSAVGHEIDVTLSDLVADRRALTPTAAGEMVVPRLCDIEDSLGELRRRLDREIEGRIEQVRLRLLSASQSWALRGPRALLLRQRERLDEFGRMLPRAMRACVDRRRERLVALEHLLETLSPTAILGRGYSITRDARTKAIVRRADSLAPGAVIETELSEGRLYSVVKRPEDDAAPSAD